MTSVAIISGAVARIEYSTEQVKPSENLQNGADRLLQGLRRIKERLIAAYDDKREKAAKFAGLEKEVVRLSYDIVERLTSMVKLPAMLRRGKVELQDLNQKLDNLQKNLENEKGGACLEQNPESSTASLGLDESQSRESTAALLARLRTELLKDCSPESSSSVACILGDSGMGKTTLAKKLFHDHQLQSSEEGPFQVFAWVSINQNFRIKRVLVTLLQQLGPRRKSDIREMNEIELIAQIFAALEEKRFLIVLDDIWGVEVWQSVRLALPTSKSSRVIITTSSMEVSQVAASSQDSIFKIPGLIQSDILTLLKETANFNPDSDVAKAISDISGGSPLIATILGKSLSAAAAATSEQELVQELLAYKPQKGTPQVLGACYKRLSPELKPYLLYLGQFPLGQDIEVEKLHTLLAAEDLIMSAEESEKSLRFRKDILEKLACMELVEVQEDIVSKHGIYKYCRLHDQVREFCKLEGSDEEFVEIVDFKNAKKVGPNTRRLAIYMNKYKDGKAIPFTSHDTVKKIGSLLIFDAFESEQNPRWPSEINDLKEFHSLIVLNFGGVDFRVRKYPKGIDKLRLLRYLSFQGCWLEELPPSLSKLTNLETLDLLVHPDCQMFIPSNILANMKGLVHLYLPKLYACDGKPKSQLLGSERLEAFYTQMKEMVHLHFPRLHVGDGKSKLQLQLQGLERLETLVNFNTEVCDVTGLSQLRKLKILAVILTGKWEELCEALEDLVAGKESSLQQLSVDIRNFDRYNSDGVSRFKKLLECPLLQSLRAKGQIGELTVEGNPAPNIAEIVLNGSELEHEHSMNVLGRFQNLRRLVLTNDAFVRSKIVISSSTADQFPNLRSLKLQNLQYLEEMRIEEGAMPELTSLEIDRCRRLAELSIPKELHDRLVKARGESGGAYSVMPLPAEFSITTSDQQVPSSSYTK